MRKARIRAGVVRAVTTAPAGPDVPATQTAPATRPVIPPLDRQMRKALEILRQKLRPDTTDGGATATQTARREPAGEP